MSQRLLSRIPFNVNRPLQSLKETYYALKSIFPDNQAFAIFAEPLENGEQILWMTHLTGSPTAWDKLGEEARQYAEKLLVKQTNELYRQLTIYHSEALANTLENCLATPDRSNLFLLRDNDGKKENDRVVLTEWSMTSSLPGSEKAWLHQLLRSQRYDMPIEVWYQGNPSETVPDVEIIAEYEGKQVKTHTDEAGIAILKLVKTGSEVQVVATDPTDGKPVKATFFCHDNGIYRVFVRRPEPPPPPPPSFIPEPEIIHTPPEPEIITPKPTPEPPTKLHLKVVDRRHRAVPHADVKLKTSDGNTHRMFADEQGLATFEDVQTGEKLESRAKKGRKKGKLDFVFDPTTPEHEIVIGSRWAWWWLLPLLLLFLPFEQKLEIKAEIGASRQALPNAEIELFMPDSTTSVQRSDSLGIAVFDSLPSIFLFEKIWFSLGGGGGTEVSVFCKENICFKGDTIAGKLENIVPATLDERTLHLERLTSPVKFLVKDYDNGRRQALPDAVVIIQLADGTQIRDTTNAAGETHSHELPVCDTVFVSATREFYTPDPRQGTLRGPVTRFAVQPAPADRRTLLLVPNKMLVRFFVKDCTNQQPIAGARVTLQTNSSKHPPRTVTSNTAGVVATVDFTIYERETLVTLLGQHPAFHDTVIQSSAQNIKNTPAQNRIIWMCPRMAAPTITVRDSENKQAIEGAELLVTLNGKTETYFTNASGDVRLPPQREDADISIEARKLPEYLVNRQWVGRKVREISSGLTILLEKPKIEPCKDEQTSGGQGDTKLLVNLGKKVTRFKFVFSTFKQPDIIYVYHGGIGGPLLWSTGGAVSAEDREVEIDFGVHGPTDVVAFRIEAQEEGTAWKFKVVCP